MAHPEEGSNKLYIWKRQDEHGKKEMLSEFALQSVPHPLVHLMQTATQVTDSKQTPNDQNQNVIRIDDISRRGIIEAAASHMWFITARSPEIFALDEEHPKEESVVKVMEARKVFMDGAEEA